MSRSPFVFVSRALLLALPIGLAGCGNKGPLFLPPPAVQQPEPAASAPATPAMATPTESPVSELPPASAAPAEQ